MPASRRDIIGSFRQQAEWCNRLGSPFTAALMIRAADALERGGPLADLIGDWPGNPIADGLPLRVAGALHALVLSGTDPALAATYPPMAKATDIDATWRAADAAMAARADHFRRYLALPPQTNEVRRSALLLPGFLEIARLTERPLRLLEIGASAGLNQLWDRYHYDYGIASWGDPDSSVRMACEWRGPPAAFAASVRIESRAACDLAPIDISDDAQRARLRSYIWPDQPERLARLDAALALTRAAGIRVETADAADWLDHQLASPAMDAVAIVYHSVVWQYLPPPTRDRIAKRLAEAGSRRSLAHLALEFAGRDYELRLTLWPGDDSKPVTRGLAATHPHGAWIDWFGARGLARGLAP